MCVACGIPTHLPRTAVVESGDPQTRFAGLRNADCRTYLIGAMLSMMADNVEHVITYWVLWVTFHSAALVGFAVIAHWVPALFSVYFGGLADRYDCRKVIQGSQGLFMAVSASWGLLFLTGSLQAWHAVVLLIVHGIASALWQPAEQLMLHDIVGLQELPSAVRLNSTFRQLGLLAGPAVGSALLLGFGSTIGIFVNVLIYLPLTVWLLRVPYTGHLRDEPGAVRPRLTVVDALGVLREVAGDPVLISMVALGGLSSFFIGAAVQPAMPDFAQDLGADQAGLAYGVLLAANAAGAVVGGFLLEGVGTRKPSARVAMLSTVAWAVCMIGFAASFNYVFSVVMLMLAGVASLASLSIAQTLVQLLAPPEKRGRVVGVYAMANSGLRTGSGFTVGLLGGLIGFHWSLGLSAAAMGILVLALMAYTSRARTAAPFREVHAA